jgi:hypothetical protein
VLDSNLPVPSHTPYLREYFRVLWKDAVARMSGGIGVILAFAAAYFEWVAKNGKTALWIAAAVAFFISGYRAWLRERRKLETEQNKNSRRDFVIEQLKELINDHKRLDIIVDANHANVVNMAVHLIGTQIDHVIRAQKF